MSARREKGYQYREEEVKEKREQRRSLAATRPGSTNIMHLTRFPIYTRSY